METVQNALYTIKVMNVIAYPCVNEIFQISKLG